MSKHYSLSFKLNAVDMVLNHGFGVRETAQLCGMPCHPPLVQWLKRFAKQGIEIVIFIIIIY